MSDRSGTASFGVIDIITGRVRQLTFTGGVRLPTWSRRFEIRPTSPLNSGVIMHLQFRLLTMPLLWA